VDLSTPFEQLFLEQHETLFISNEVKMTVTEGKKRVVMSFYEQYFGYNPEEQRLKAEEEKQKAEEERLRAEEQRQKTEGERQHLVSAIAYLHQMTQLGVPQIALILKMSEEEVQEILERPNQEEVPE
jgi:sortase (surface protein transpeptidase)